MSKSGDRETRVAVLGASGYTGAELLRLLANHPHAKVVVLSAERHAGAPVADVFPHLGGLDLPDLLKVEQVEWAGLDVDIIFCAMPHGASQDIVAGLMHATGHTLVDELMREERSDLVSGLKADARIIDLSADFRLTDEATYSEWYGKPHRYPSLLEKAVYGLTELNRDDLPDARLVACPGCYPTAALLPLLPLVEAGLIAPDGIIIDAKSGVSGAGRALNEANLFAEINEGVRAYGLAGHRHAPEVEQAVSAAAGRPVTVNFTPHLVPMNRGILATIYVELAGAAGVAELRAALSDAYADAPFVRLLPEGADPATHHVSGSNHCLIGVFADRLKGRAILISVIDNLVKGASGQAIQNMNLMLGYPETAGLEQEPLFP